MSTATTLEQDIDRLGKLALAIKAERDAVYQAALALVNMKNGGYPENMMERAFKDLEDAVDAIDD